MRSPRAEPRGKIPENELIAFRQEPPEENFFWPFFGQFYCFFEALGPFNWPKKGQKQNIPTWKNVLTKKNFKKQIPIFFLKQVFSNCFSFSILFYCEKQKKKEIFAFFFLEKTWGKFPFNCSYNRSIFDRASTWCAAL